MVDFVKFKKSDDSDERPKSRPKFRFSFKRLFLFVLGFMILSSLITSISISMAPKIAVVPIVGAIISEGGNGGILSGDYVNSRYISEELYNILDDGTIKAVILDINSPGGSPVASEEISRAIEAVKKADIPVYAIINDIGASGAFWVAMSADKVYASSMSTVGSIGVTSAGLSFENLIKDYNITYRKQTAGEFKDMGSPFREPTSEEERKIQVILDEVHESFINHVAKSRDLSVDEVREVATGEIFLGSFAKNKGYVDVIGNYRDVVVDLRNIVGNDTMIMDYGPEKTLFETLGVSTVFPQFSSKSQILLQ